MRPRSLCFLLSVSAVALLMAGSSGATNRAFPTSQGWVDPAGTATFEDWGFDSCNPPYWSGKAHLGADSQGTKAGQVVVAFGPGKVVQRVESSANSGWPGGVIGIEQTASDGSRFLAVYAHIVPSVAIGGTVAAGTPIGTIYNQNSNSHVHLGVRPLAAGENASTVVMRGNSPCTSTAPAPTYGYVDPIPWIAARQPMGAGSGGGAQSVWFVKTKNTGSKKVEVHSATAVSNYTSGVASPSRFVGWVDAQHPGDANNGWFQMVGNDLWFIKTKNTGSLKVEVHQVTAASAYQSGLSAATYFSQGEADSGWFQMVGADLYYIKTKNTGSQKVEIHSATASSGYQSGIHVVTRFAAQTDAQHPGDANNGWFQMVGSDLYFIKTKNVQSGKVEVHSVTAASGYQSGTDVTSWFSSADADNGWFQMDGPSLLAFIKTRNTPLGQNNVELHTRSAPTFQSGIDLVVKRFGTVDQNNGWFSLDGK